MKRSTWLWAGIAAVVVIVLVLVFTGWKPGTAGKAAEPQIPQQTAKKDTDVVAPSPSVQTAAATTLDTALYNQKMQWIVNGDSTGKWPVKADYPLPGAILPFKRVLAFYGNLYSTKMGILGELPEKEMLAKLQEEVKNWHAADTTMEVVPALHYIAVTAQGSAGADGKYRLRMAHGQIDKILAMAEKINALVFIDIQVGLSSLQAEVPLLEKYLKMPHVHLGIDPEFSMKTGKKPGSVIGTFDAADINYTTEYLAKLVKENNLPPKMLVVHRFTQAMVTNYKNIKLRPEAQLIMDMDGWGAKARKISTYRSFIHREPVQYTGFKLFYKNDFREKGSAIMTPAEVLKLKPQPIYIQYQ
ncbi:hypothetical protein HHL16_09425 [Pseudoflavitalea sp. G-6-1-2]|uniref:hypothetical protein n=1 Tax=Pseudoflavitalea sp. G-6-1-2 TaxID=2728841 RepID=UPI00146F7499|nr:hypothetical protein [Pseudoflavitalea sp. G-6-1-2]NML21093.1 hypothetical protein [Pseudoflavitalea sp. G-6-1-2]